MLKVTAARQHREDMRAQYMADGRKGSAAHRRYLEADAAWSAAVREEMGREDVPTSSQSPKFREDYRLERDGGRNEYGFPFVLTDAATGERVARIHARGGIEDAWTSAWFSSPVLARYGRPGLSWGTY